MIYYKGLNMGFSNDQIVFYVNFIQLPLLKLGLCKYYKCIRLFSPKLWQCDSPVMMNVNPE